MANTAEERRALLEVYPPVSHANSAWVKKVNTMSDPQVHAIYIRLKDQGKIK